MISLQQWNDLAKPGDIVGFSGADFASDVINLGSFGWPRWGLSHVGILCPHENNLLLFESTTFNEKPCVIQNKMFSGTQAQWPRDKVFTYNGRVWLYSLRRRLRASEIQTLHKFLLGTIGTPYDMIGAFRSGGREFSRFEAMLRGENLHRIFCSEWCAAALRTVNRFGTDDASKWNPNSFTRELLSRVEVVSPVRVK